MEKISEEKGIGNFAEPEIISEIAITEETETMLLKAARELTQDFVEDTAEKSPRPLGKEDFRFVVECLAWRYLEHKGYSPHEILDRVLNDIYVDHRPRHHRVIIDFAYPEPAETYANELEQRNARNSFEESYTEEQLATMQANEPKESRLQEYRQRLSATVTRSFQRLLRDAVWSGDRS